MTTEQFEHQLKERFEDRLKVNEPMAKHTNFRIGGPAQWFVEAKTVEELTYLLALAHEHGVKHFVFGGGSNMLVSDDGFDGLVIKLANREIQIDGTHVRAEAGALMVALARKTAMEGLAGLTWAISLPGTVGGAVRGNAGCHGGETRDHLVEVELYRDGEIVTVPKDELAMTYRESSIKHSDDIVLAATFELSEGDPEELKAQMQDSLAKRKASQPLHAGSAGCLFKNYEIESDEELQRIVQKLDIPSEMRSTRRISVGWLIDQADLKGTRVGDAQISDEHGNFVINLGQATADHVTQLIAVIKTRIRDRFGIGIQEEVQYVGFDESST